MLKTQVSQAEDIFYSKYLPQIHDINCDIEVSCLHVTGTKQSTYCSKMEIKDLASRVK